jgi:hypothetical protein
MAVDPAQAAAEHSSAAFWLEHFTALLAMPLFGLEPPTLPVTLTRDTAIFGLALGGAFAADAKWSLQAILRWGWKRLRFCYELSLAALAGAGVKPTLRRPPNVVPTISDGVTASRYGARD